MWPFKKKKQKEKEKNKEKDLIRMTPKIPVSNGLPVYPTIPIEPNFPEGTIVPAETEKKKPVDLESLTVIELKEIAKEQGLHGYSSMKKADLIDLLKGLKIYND